MSSFVLVVDDEDAARMLLAEFLSDAGYQVEGAADCRTAIEVSERAELSLAIVDINLPDGSGLDLIGRFRERFPALKALVLSGTEQCDVEADCRARGVQIDGCVTKPFSLAALLDEVTALIGAA